jgi:hypothetical protein
VAEASKSLSQHDEQISNDPRKIQEQIAAKKAEMERLQNELQAKLDNPEGASEEEQTESRKRTLEELSELMSEIKCRKRMRTQASVATSGSVQASTTIIAETTSKLSCKDLNPTTVGRFADQLKDYEVRTGRHHSADQLRLMFSDQDTIELTQTFKSFRFNDGAAIDDAGNWLRWGDNSKLCDILKHLYPRSEAVSDVARIVSISFKTF